MENIKTFTKKIKNAVFDSVYNADRILYNQICNAAENCSVLEKIRVCYCT